MIMSGSRLRDPPYRCKEIRHWIGFSGWRPAALRFDMTGYPTGGAPMRFGKALLGVVAGFGLGLAVIFPARAADDRCLALAHGPGPRLVQPAGFRVAQLQSGEVRISYVGHSTFLIESQRGVRIATDYNDYVKPSIVPDIATMNRAHSTHYTEVPDPGIRHVLRGWSYTGGAAMHDLTHNDVRVRNVPTNIRDWQGGTSVYGNSIFVFEMGNLCIAHLGHLHHTLTTQQLAQLGQMDVVLVPVDGSYTLDLPGTVEVLRSLKAPLMIPMHYFSSYTLQRFLDAVSADFEVKTSEVPTIVVSRATLPQKQQVLVLPGG
jgi:L-ascorbate metabolism protein UlaG (beta-lactamase superfamily)